jgi:PRTRC genetic system protein B
MIKVNQNFEQIYQPHKALLIYNCLADENNVYVESYDIGANGNPINAHPLSEAESIALARSLAESKELSSNFLQPKGIVPENLVYTSIGLDGYAVWYTKPQQVSLRFTTELGIPNGTAPVPALLWKANKKELSIYALKLKAEERPTLETPLYHAPFFNIYKEGKVCMGTVKVEIEDRLYLEDFMSQWESYFFNSNFSHTMHGHVPAKTNIIQLWKNLIESGIETGQHQRFANQVLKPNGQQFKDLIK